jgi:3-hydroxyisobutyrate dehydrogenase-like beta-hydroxyacid dehydrogenase
MQDAVAFLVGQGSEAAGTARKALAGVSDLERAVARLFASTVAGAAGRDAVNVVLYEDAAKRKVLQSPWHVPPSQCMLLNSSIITVTINM